MKEASEFEKCVVNATLRYVRELQTRIGKCDLAILGLVNAVDSPTEDILCSVGCFLKQFRSEPSRI